MQKLHTIPATATLTSNLEHSDKPPLALLVDTADYFLHGRLLDLAYKDGAMWPEFSITAVL